MGACVSSTSSSKSGTSVGGGGGGGSTVVKRLSTAAKVVHMEGRVQEFRQSVQAKNIVSQNSGHFICSSESMPIGTCVPHVPDDEYSCLPQVPQVPLSQSHKPLSLPDLCSLAIKASAGLRFVDRSTDSKLILRRSRRYDLHALLPD